MYVRITYKDGTIGYAAENRKNLYLTEKPSKAFQYGSTLEFKVSWQLLKIGRENYYDYLPKEQLHLADKRNAAKFEITDRLGNNLLTFDAKAQELPIGQTVKVPTATFERLKRCGITSSNWCYDAQDNWIAFPKKEDLPKITKIDYYVRGLTHTMQSHNNWGDRYDEHSWHGVYELHHQCMMDPTIMQICLLNLGDCHRITVLEDKEP